MERVIDFTPFTEEHEDSTATLGVTALIEEDGIFAIADYPMCGEFEGSRFIVFESTFLRDTRNAWFRITGLAVDFRSGLGEVA